MSKTLWVRLSGLAAVLGGVLRGIVSFILSTPTIELEFLYFATDVFILFGIVGLYCFQRKESELWGFVGFLLAIIGIAIIRIGAISGINLYAIGASIFAIGLSSFAVGTWIARRLPKWIPIFWITSTIIGFIGYFAPGFNFLFVISGVLFGVGFAGAGFKVWS